MKHNRVQFHKTVFLDKSLTYFAYENTKIEMSFKKITKWACN